MDPRAGLLLRLGAALVFVRCLAYIPVVTPAPDLHALFEREPFLATLDVLSGGALARSAILALGVFPYLAGWVMARLTYGNVEGASDDLRRRSRAYLYTALAAIYIGSVYLYLLHRSADVPFPVAGVFTLTAGSLLFAWIGEFTRPNLGVRFFVAANVLAALPTYVLPDLKSISEAVVMLLTLFVGLFVHSLFLTARRNIPTRSAQRLNPRLPIPEMPLPISLDASGLIPLLLPLAALGTMRAGAFMVAGSGSGLIRSLASVELQLTDMRNPAFWITLFILAVPLKVAYDYSAFNPADIAVTLKKTAMLIPGLRPGAATEAYLRKIWSRVAWVGGVATMLVLTVVALIPYTRGRSGLWPVMLGLTLSTVGPLLNLKTALDSAGLGSKYRGFVKAARLRR